MSMTPTNHEIEELKPASLAGHRDIVVHSNYSRIGEHLRQVTPPELQCSVFCGGKRCKYDTSEYWTPEEMAIDGLYSHWITDNILAMARPNMEVIQNKNLVNQFLKNNIRTIINLQISQEHASCGAPLTETGFSYDPSVFMEHGIFYYNFGLRDHSEPTLIGILDMVKVLAFSQSEGKVAIHCHAGLGRTGVLIACFLVYSLKVRANDAIRYIRMKRPNAVQTSGQIMVVQEFEAFILPLLYVFCNKEFLKDKKNVECTLQQFLYRQRTVLHGYEARALKNIPKIIFIICERLLKLCGCSGPSPTSHVLAPLEISYTIGTPAFTSFFLSAQFDHESSRVSYSAPQSLGSPSYYSSLSGSRSGVRDSSEEDSGITRGEDFSVGDVSAPSSAQYSSKRLSQDRTTPDVPSCSSEIPDQDVDHLLDDGVENQQLTDNTCYQELATHIDLKQQAEHETIEVVQPKDIYEALLADHTLLDAEYKKNIKTYRIDLNIKQSAWEKLKNETDLHVLTGLLFAWMEHLKLPIFTVDALSYIVLASHKPEVCLRKMDKETRYTLEYLVRFISRLQPFSRDQTDDIIRRIIAALTQQSVPVREILLPSGRGITKLREGTLGKCIEFMGKLYDAVHLDSRTESAFNSSTPSTVTCVTPPGQVSSHASSTVQ